MKPDAKFLLKTEAGHRIGFGHVRRLLRIARGLEERNCQVSFAVTELSNLTEMIPFSVIHLRDPKNLGNLASEFDGIILDEPSISAKLLQEMKSFRLKIGIDELGCARELLDLHFCTTLLGLRSSEEKRGNTHEFIGPKYFIFPEEDPCETISREFLKILISMGGTDPGELCGKFLSGLFSEFKNAHNYQWYSILGPGYADDYKARLVRTYPQIHWLDSQTSMNHLYASSQAIVCCGGITPYEALKQGCLPLMLPQMQEQFETASALNQLNLGVLFGTNDSINWNLFSSTLESDSEEKRRLAEKNFKELIGEDPTSRVLDIICDYAKHRSL